MLWDWNIVRMPLQIFDCEAELIAYDLCHACTAAVPAANAPAACYPTGNICT